MATPTYNNAGSTAVYDGGASSLTLSSFSLNAGSERFLEVWVASASATNDGAPTGVTWGGNALTSRGGLGTAGASNVYISKWYIKEADFPSGATGNIVASWSNNREGRFISACGYSGVSQAAPYRNASQTTAEDLNDTTPDIVVSSATDDLVSAGCLVIVDAAGMSTFSVTTGTERTETAIMATYAAQSVATNTGAASTTVAWTRNSTTNGSALMLGDSLQSAFAVAPTVGTLRYVGQTPTVSQGSSPVVVTPSVGTLRYVGQTPTVTSPAVVAPSAGTLRISGNTPTLPVSGGARTALIFPSNGSSPVRFRFSGTGNYPDIMPLTLLWRHYPVQQTGYYTTFFHSRTDGSFVGDQTYFGCHPYPPTGGSGGTVHNWEIAIEGEDDITDENANSTVVTKNAWYSQAASTRSNGAGQSIVDYYWDLATAATRRISHTTADGQLTNAASAPGITFGCASWNDTENLSGRLRGIQIYSSQLSEADIEALSDCEYDAEVVAVCAARSITSLWYLNCNPTPDDITDKSGNGNDPAWVGAARPTLWLEVLPTSGALRFDGQQPTVSATSSAAVTPSVGTFRVVGQTPTVAFTDHQAVTPSVGAFQFTGQQPTVSYTAHVTVAPAVGALQFAGQQPVVAFTDHVTVTPSVGTYRFGGQQPSVTSSAAQSVAPSVGTLRFEGLQPTATVSEPGLASPQVGTIRFLGQQPSVGYTHSVDPLSAVVRLEGAYPSVTVTANAWASPVTGAVQFNGQQPSTALTANIWTEPSAGTLMFIGQQPALTEGGDKTTAPESGVLRLVGNAPVASLPRERVGGDDLPPGWSKRRARLKLNRELEYTEQIREIYRQLTGSPQAAEAEAILAPVVSPVAATGESEDARLAAIEARAEALRVRADRLDYDAVQAEIALRLLYQQWRQQMEDDDVAAMELLLSHVL